MFCTGTADAWVGGMTTSQTKPFRVVAAVDLSDASVRVLRRALLIAHSIPGSELHAVQVVEPMALGIAPESAMVTAAPNTASLPELTKFCEEQSKELALRVGPLHVGRIVAHLLTGAPAREIVWLAAHVEADLIIVGTHGRTGLKRMLLGSVAEAVVRRAGCPVFVERPFHHDPAAHDPEIEPLCPDCRARREATQGAEMWCSRHAEHHPHAHLYSGSQMPSSRGPWGFSLD